MSRLLRTLLLGLLKLVLQLIILAVTGKWVQIGRPQPQSKAKSRGKKRERPRPLAGTRTAGGQRPLFERRRLGAAPAGGALLDDGEETLEEWGAAREAELPSYEASSEGGATGREHPGQRPRERRRRKQAPTMQSPQPSSLARALRDPRAIRQAILLGSAIAPRRR